MVVMVEFLPPPPTPPRHISFVVEWCTPLAPSTPRDSRERLVTLTIKDKPPPPLATKRPPAPPPDAAIVKEEEEEEDTTGISHCVSPVANSS
jgi:hypothetical protein